MEKNGEGPHPDKKYSEQREKFMIYLLERAGDENYPENITSAVFKLHAELLKYPDLKLQRGIHRFSIDSIVNKVLDRLSQKIVELRQMLVRANLGDSPLAQTLAKVHDNIRG